MKTKSQNLGKPEIIQSPAEKNTEQRAQALVPYEKKYEALTEITVEATYIEVSTALNWAKNSYASAETERKKLVKPFNDGVKGINRLYKERTTGPLLELIDNLSLLMGGYVDRKRLAEQKSADKEAKKAEKKGEVQFANDIRDEAVRAKVAPQSDVGTKLKWSAEVFDFKLFLQAVIDGAVDKDLVQVNYPQLNALARAYKKENIGVPGVKGVSETTFSRKS